ncbi:MAG: hypothetical protein R8P61_03135 [Bacteroidia bacterium]|nr:hypothetical protein [Bacteroidia bacterium]
MKKTNRALLVIGIIVFGACSSDTEADGKMKEPGDPKFNQVIFSEETQSFSFMALGPDANVFPIMDKLGRLWGEPSIYPAQLRRNKFADYFVGDDHLSNSSSRSKIATQVYSYLYCWYETKFPNYAGANNSISVYINPVVISSPLWENMYPEEWDSFLSFRALEITKVEIRISPDNISGLELYESEIEVMKKVIQPLIDEELGPPMELIPPKQHFVDFLELYKKKEDIKKRFPPEMQEGYFPVVGIPRDRNEIDLRLSYSYPISKSVEYQIKITDSLNNSLDHVLYVSNKWEKRELDKLIIPKSDASRSAIDTYIYHIRINQPELVNKISLKRNNDKEYLIYKKGDQTCSGFLMKDVSSISQEK